MNEILLVLLKSSLIGLIVGFAVGVGVARMFHAPQSQAIGAFRTLGEMNACAGDRSSHVSFGLGFFFTTWASSLGAGSYTQDIIHRLIPNWAAAIVMRKGISIENTLHNPLKMGIAGAVVGMVLVAFFSVTTVAIPTSIRSTALDVLTPAALWLIHPVMPVIFWLAALDAGKRSGFWGTIFGGLSHIIMGNAVPGIIAGIVLGKGVDDNGWNKATGIVLSVIIVLFLYITLIRQAEILETYQSSITIWFESMRGDES